MSNDYESRKRLLKQFTGRKIIAFSRPFVDITGSVTSGLLLSQILYWSDLKEEVGQNEFYKTNDEFCKETGLGLSEFKSAKANLQKLKIINIEVKGLPAKSFYSVNHDVLLDKLDKNALKPLETDSRSKTDQLVGDAENSSRSKTDQLAGRKPTNTYKEAETNHIEPPIVPQEGDTFSLHNKKGKLKEATYSKDFEKFWDTYPVKKGKDAAYRSFGKATKRIPVEDLLERVKTFRTLRDEDKSEFIPNPSTWLSQGRWMDEEVEILMKNVDDKKARADSIQQLKSSGDPWQAFCADLMEKIGVPVYKSWIGGKLFLYEIKDELACFGCESAFVKDWINQNFIVEIERCFLKHYENVIGVKKVGHIKLSEMPKLPNILIATDV